MQERVLDRLTAAVRSNTALLAVSFGYGLYLAWSLIGSSATLFSPINTPAIETLAIRNPLERTIWITALVACALLALGLSARSFRRVLAITAGSIVTLGTLATYISAWLFPDLIDVMKMPTLVSSAFIALWGEQICAFKERQTVICVAGSGLFSFALVLACMLVEPHVQAMLHVLAAAGSTALLAYAMKLGGTSGTPASLGFGENARQAIVSIPIGPFLGLGLFASVIVLLQSFSERKADVPDELLWIISGVAVYLIVLLIALLSKESVKASSFSRPMLPLLVLATFLVFATDFGQQTLEVLAVGCSWVYFRFFTWIIWRVGTVRTGAVPLCTIAIGQLILSLGAFAGGMVYDFMQSIDVPPLVSMAVICVASVLVATYCLDTNRVAQIADGRPLFDPTDPALCERCVDAATDKYGLSDRERAVARLLVRGNDNQQIQDELVIATATLRTHLRNLYRKTSTHSREELVVLLRSLT